MQVILNYYNLKQCLLRIRIYFLTNVYNFAVMKRRHHIYATLFWTLLFLLLLASDLFNGIGWGEIILTKIRLPRALTALLAGGGLALAGAQMQSILRNPLADPHILGISSGASLGAAAATLAGGWMTTGNIFSSIPIAVSSIAGALLSSLIIMAASKRFRKASTLLVFGVMLGFIANAIITVMQSVSDAESLKIFLSWSAGSFATTSGSDLAIIAAVLGATCILSAASSRGLDIILFGDDYAELTGAKPNRIRFRALLGCCMITGAVTAFCGPIGFVGITAPHIARAFWKTSAHKTILPASFLCGGTIGIAADLLSHAGAVPIPVSSTMAVAGIPVIIYIMIKDTGTGL